ncbi:hypothetical protein NUW58_g7738 [Xylaria curta]|uniref:Uncharacterized protein n=1 Tax=Xylaria curta TaxID=42375 RepID=A0ACC1NED1_9PEZI|nr:hypothetical protein NUW58_g7738 [Xylaria curta]
MAPIPVYTDSPITAAKPDGVTPKTVSRDSASNTNKARASPTSTYTPSMYAAARPGAAPSLPTPTSTGPNVTQPYPPLQSTPTTSIASANTSRLPKTRPPVATMIYPHQMAIPAPAAPQPSQQRGTSTTTMAPSLPYGTRLPSTTMGISGDGGASLSHPAGYQQNANASELDHYQRSAMEQRELDDNGDSIWGAAKRLAQQTGERLAAAESGVWKKINKE